MWGTFQLPRTCGHEPDPGGLMGTLRPRGEEPVPELHWGALVRQSQDAGPPGRGVLVAQAAACSVSRGA